MKHTLPDGRSFQLENVLRVSKIRDEGLAGDLVEYSRLSFHITVADGEAIEVSFKYLYADWPEQKKRLSRIRENLLNALKDKGLEVDDG